MTDRLADDELQWIADSPACFDGVHIRLAVELLELRAAQRPPLGMRDIADTLAYLACKVVGTDDKVVRKALTDTFEDLLDRLPEGALAEVRDEVQP